MINSISKYKFTKLEQSLISELLHYSIGKKVEAARIIKNGKDITDKFIIRETDTRCSILARGEVLPCHESKCPIFNIVKMKMLLKDSIFIHYHPLDLPFSYGDILMTFSAKLKKMIAVHSKEKFCIFVPNLKAKISVDDFKARNKKLREQIKTAGSEKVFIEDKKMIEKYKEDIHNFWIKFAHDTKSKYISTM